MAAKSSRMKGRNLMLFKTDADGKTGATAFAFAETCTVTSTLKTEEVSDKDAPETGDLIVVGSEWTASTTNGIATIADFEKVMEAHLKGEKLTLAFAPVGNENPDGITEQNTAWTVGEGGYFGNCLIESVTVTANNGQKVTYTANFKGTSTLKKRA